MARPAMVQAAEEAAEAQTWEDAADATGLAIRQSPPEEESASKPEHRSEDRHVINVEHMLTIGSQVHCYSNAHIVPSRNRSQAG